MKTLKLSTNLIGLDGLYCTYHGLGNPDRYDDTIKNDFEDGYSEIGPEYFWQYWDNGKYMSWWDKTIQDGLDEVICDAFKYHLDLEITYVGCGHWSPREYNHSCDINNFDLESNDFQKLLDYCEANGEEFQKFLKDHYTSYDGFRSHTANNLEHWREDISENDMTAWGAAVRFFLHNVVETYDFESILTEHDMYHMPHEFVNYTALDEFKEECKLHGGPLDLDDAWKKEYFLRNSQECIDSYIKDNSLTSDEDINQYLQEKFDVDFNFLSVIQKSKSEIDNLTHKLF